MNCKEAYPLIHAFLDGDLAEPESMRLSGHMADCAACKAHLAELERAEALIRSLPKTQPSADLTDRILHALPAPKRRSRMFAWVRQHPAVAAASVFVLVMLGSFMSMWGQDKDMVVKGADLDQVVIQGNTVYVPAGHTVKGNLLVQRGKVEVAGEVTGNLVVIDGSYNLASTAKIAGQVRQVDQALEWLWYKAGELASTVSP